MTTATADPQLISDLAAEIARCDNWLGMAAFTRQPKREIKKTQQYRDQCWVALMELTAPTEECTLTDDELLAELGVEI